MDRLIIVTQEDGLVDFRPIVNYFTTILERRSMEELEIFVLELIILLREMSVHSGMMVSEETLDKLSEFQELLKSCRHAH